MLSKPLSIYVISNAHTDGSYVGQTCNLKARSSDHQRKLERGMHPSRRMQAEFDLSPIGSVCFLKITSNITSQTLTDYMERFLISAYRSLDGHRCYNSSSGGKSGFEKSPEEPIDEIINFANNKSGYLGKDSARREWSEADERKALSKKIIQSHKESGFSKVHAILGEKLTTREGSEKYGIETGAIYSRLQRGWSMERAVVTPLRSLQIEAFGRSMTAKEWGAEYNIAQSEINRRILRGKSPEEAISKPVRKIKKRAI